MTRYEWDEPGEFERPMRSLWPPVVMFTLAGLSGIAALWLLRQLVREVNA